MLQPCLTAYVTVIYKINNMPKWHTALALLCWNSACTGFWRTSKFPEWRGN